MKNALGDRMKTNYEKPWNTYLPWRMPVIIRLDGKNFHGLTKDMERPFDDEFITYMQGTTEVLCRWVQTTVFAYSQSDEISLLLHSYKKLDSEPYFSNEIQKIASITAAMASAYFTLAYNKDHEGDEIISFDARCFVLPEEEVVNYFIWRQQDATRNSLNMVAQSKFSHKELQGKSTQQIQEMLYQKDKTNWDRLPIYKKRGFAYHKTTTAKKITKPMPMSQEALGIGSIDTLIQVMDWNIDLSIPIFSKNRNYIKKWLKIDENANG